MVETKGPAGVMELRFWGESRPGGCRSAFGGFGSFVSGRPQLTQETALDVETRKRVRYVQPRARASKTEGRHFMLLFLRQEPPQRATETAPWRRVVKRSQLPRWERGRG